MARLISMRLVWGVLVSFGLSACGAPKTTLDTLIERKLAGSPEWAVQLLDMNEEGNFFKTHQQKFRLVKASKNTNGSANNAASGVADSTANTDQPVGPCEGLQYSSEDTAWLDVSEEQYQKYASDLGMTIAQQRCGQKRLRISYPSNYQYVGDPRYGAWRQDSSGLRFWEFYGQYALLRDLSFGVGGPSHRIYSSDWDSYRAYRQNNRPYYGSKNQWGTHGNSTRNTRPDFFTRRTQLDRARKASFAARVAGRASRSNMSSYRSRSGGWGK